MASVTVKSAITPFLSGLMAEMFPGVLPIMLCASLPTASGFPVATSTATTDGSFKTTPWPFFVY